jgi:hypothetical protein
LFAVRYIVKASVLAIFWFCCDLRLCSDFRHCLEPSPAFDFVLGSFLSHSKEQNRKNIPFDETEEVWKFVVFGVGRPLSTSQLIIFYRGDKPVLGTSKSSEHQLYLKWHAFREHVCYQGDVWFVIITPCVILSAFQHF